MPNYVPTDWADGVTPVDEAHLDKMEAGIVGAVPRDGSVAAAATLYRSKLLAADAQPAFQQKGDGRMEWGPGGATAPDNTLYRVAAGILQTNSTLGSVGTAGYFGFGTKVTGNPQFRWGATNDGMLYWGDGGGGQDTNLYRSSAQTLKTDGYFLAGADIYAHYGIAAEQIALTGANGRATIVFGSAFDTNLYRQGADILATDDSFRIYRSATTNYGLVVAVTGEAGKRFAVEAGGRLLWGDGTAAEDTTLYRSGANELGTGGGLRVGTSLVVDQTNVGGRLYFGPALDTTLSRAFAACLQTESTFLIVNPSTGFWFKPNAAGGIALLTQVGAEPNPRFYIDYGGYHRWGDGTNAPDTNLYRSAPGVLKTDGSLNLGGGIDAGGSIYSHAGWGYVGILAGDTNMRLGLYSTGSAIYFGPGNAAEDTNLSRLAPGVLGINGVPIGNATRTRQYPLKLMAPRSSAFAGNAFWTVAAMSGFDYPHWEFVKDVEGRVFGQILSPKTVAATPNAKIVLILCCMATAGVSRMNVHYALLGTTGGWLGGSLTPIGAQDIAMPATTSGFVKATFAVPAGITADQMIFLEIVHEGNHANDTLAVNTMLVEAYLEIDS